MVSLQPSAAILGAQIALGSAIERHAVAPLGRDATTLDLLLRVMESPGGECRAVDLCRQLQLSPGYVSKRVDKAVAAGLVARRADPGDRRSQVLSLTDEGRRVADEFRPLLEGVLERVIFETLTATERDTLVELLGRVEAACLDLVDD